MYAPVAQLDRVTDYESVGRGFESLLAYQKAGHPNGCPAFWYILKRPEGMKTPLAFGIYTSYLALSAMVLK